MAIFFFVLFQKQFSSKLKEMTKNLYCSIKAPSDCPNCVKEQFNIFGNTLSLS